MTMLADGGLETRIIYEFGRALPDFEAWTLLADGAGRAMLREIYTSYLAIAQKHGLAIQIGTPTWRASARWMGAGGDVAFTNASAVTLLRGFIDESGADAVLAGVMGPATDGYDPADALGEEEAYTYHGEQARALAGARVDLLYAPTFPSFRELCGAARAMAETGVPYALAPMLHPDGTMIDGTPLDEAIVRIDARVAPAPDHYMIGCLYPTHAQTALEAARSRNPAAVARVRGLKANASALSPEQLDHLSHVDAARPAQFARDLIACADAFGLGVLGGCCGTDAHDIEAVAALVSK
ncbi:MAG TPA: homocysteine S-methyltransferase family protein [Candidatus Acidoferrales bacterium]|jgi:S-methylmethionine-dependent homocysteine/selenocysteine methylase|nr:homocysteine S-methyltransferase family protein [Candidatus Acidoferrales bacterium]